MTTGARRWRDTVVDDSQRPSREVGPVVRTGDGEGLAEPRRARAEIAVTTRLGATGAHDLDAVDRRGRTQQHRRRFVR